MAFNETARILKNNRGEHVLIGWQDHKGRNYIDIRTWYLDRDTGALKPTPRGLSFDIELVDQVIAALEEFMPDGS